MKSLVFGGIAALLSNTALAQQAIPSGVILHGLFYATNLSNSQCFAYSFTASELTNGAGQTFSAADAHYNSTNGFLNINLYNSLISQVIFHDANFSTLTTWSGAGFYGGYSTTGVSVSFVWPALTVTANIAFKGLNGMNCTQTLNGTFRVIDD